MVPALQAAPIFGGRDSAGGLLYFRCTLILCEVEEMMAERGVDVGYDAVRVWTVRFGPEIAVNLRRRRLLLS